MKFVALLLVATSVRAADTTCDPTKLVDGCATDGSTRCQTSPDNANTKKNTCIPSASCTDPVTCSKLGQACVWTTNTSCGDGFTCATNTANQNKCVPTGACGTDPVTCSDVNATCDSTKTDQSAVCSAGFTRCATAPAEKLNKCIPSSDCDKNGTTCAVTTCDPTKLVDGCAADGSTRCQTAPAANAKQCIAKDKCNTGTGPDKIECSDLNNPCVWTVNTACTANFSCATNTANQNKCVPTGACGTDPVTCSDVNAECDSTKADQTGQCSPGFTSCATAPANKLNKCIPSTDCTKGDNGCAGITRCDPNNLVDGCKAGVTRCQTSPATSPDINTCIPDSKCNTGTGADEIKCSDNGQKCNWTDMTTTCTDKFNCATNTDNRDTCVPKTACGTGDVTCTDVGSTCDSTKTDQTGQCSDGFTSCATAPADKLNKCIPTGDCVKENTSCAGVTKCDPTLVVDGCGAGERCAINDNNKNECVKQETCGQGDIKCTDNGQKCDWTKMTTGCTDGFSCATNTKNKNTCVPKGQCGVVDTDTVTCTDVGTTCDSTKTDGSTCTKDLTSCATAPASKMNKCIPSTECNTTVAEVKTTCAGSDPNPKGKACDPNADDKGCGDGKNCATAPPDLKDTCVASEACGQKDADGVETTCGASALVGTLLTAFAVASTM